MAAVQLHILSVSDMTHSLTIELVMVVPFVPAETWTPCAPQLSVLHAAN